MQLDFNSASGAFILRFARGEADPQVLMREQGLDFSATASTADQCVMFTREPYAAVGWWEHGTQAARARLNELKVEIDMSWAAESQAHIEVPMDEELAPFQKAGVEYALRRNNTLIGDVPGLGKTPMAVAWTNEIRARRTLVLCPANIRLQWIKNIRRWSTMAYPYVTYPILVGKHGVHPTANWTVVSYDLARTPAIGAALARGSYDALVMDEAHYLKENTSKRTRAVFGGGVEFLFEPLAHRCGAMLALTGTPLPNRPREAYTLARGMCFDAIDWMSEDSFRERFNPSMTRETEEGKMYVDERAGRHGELQARLRGNFMVRREKYGPNGVGKQLGMLNMPAYDLVFMEESGPIKAAIQAERMLDIDPDDLSGADMSVLGAIAAVRRQMGVAMAPAVADYVEMLLAGGEEKIVVFGHHIEVLDILCAKLRKYGVTRIDGSDGATRKQKKVDEWIASPKLQVIAGNMLSMGTGTDGLQKVCRRAVFAEPDWVDGTNQQAVDRLDRGGQEAQVLVDFCVVQGSMSEKVLATALRKSQVTHKALDAKVA